MMPSKSEFFEGLYAQNLVRARKWYLYYALCDESYAMLSRDVCPEGVNLSAYRLLVTLLDQASWITGSFLGGWLGSLLAFDSTGIDFAMTALFTTVFIQQWIDSKCHIPALLGITATLACRLLFGHDFFLIPAMIIILGTLIVMREKIDSRMGGQNGVHPVDSVENQIRFTASDQADRPSCRKTVAEGGAAHVE